MPDLLKALGIVVALILFALPQILRAIAANKRRQEQMPDRDRAPSAPRPTTRPPADPLEELRRRIETAAQRRREEEARRTGAPTAEQPAQASRPQSQMPPRPVETRPQAPRTAQPRPQPQQPPQPRPAPALAQPAAQKRRRQPASRQAPDGTEDRLGRLVTTLKATEAPGPQAAEPASTALLRIESFPPLQRAIVMAEVLAKPRALRDDI